LTTAVIGTCVWAGVDKVWEQKKLEARKMLENAADSHTSGARFVSPLFDMDLSFVIHIHLAYQTPFLISYIAVSLMIPIQPTTLSEKNRRL
jgi:hypothetical protein